MEEENMSREATAMMSVDPQAGISPTTSGTSPGIIEDPLAMLPEEMWENVFKFTKYRDILTLKSVSKHFNAIATQVLNTKYKWYELCRKKVPERHWFKILENVQHPVNDRINCENFHDEREFAIIWGSLYSTWIGWSAMRDKEPDVQELAFSDEDILGLPNISSDGNILAVYKRRRDVISFYDILELAAGSIYSIPCPRYLCGNKVTKKGTDLTATLVRRVTNTRMTVEKWNVKSQQLIDSKSVRQVQNAFICESFGYFCTITTYPKAERDFCRVEIRPVASNGDVHLIRLELGENEYVNINRAYGNTLMILTVHENDDLIKIYKISIRECQLRETHVTSINNRQFGNLFLFQPCVVANCDYSDRHDESDDTIIGFSVSGREWKIYDTTRDLNLEAPIITDALVYEGGVLALLMKNGNVQLIYVDDPDDLDSKLETLPSKMVTLNWDNLFAVPRGNALSFRDIDDAILRFTEYNSKIYLIIAIVHGAIILEF